MALPINDTGDRNFPREDLALGERGGNGKSVMLLKLKLRV